MKVALVPMSKILNGLLIARRYVTQNTVIFRKPLTENFTGDRNKIHQSSTRKHVMLLQKYKEKQLFDDTAF